ncbi:hypothetical protein J3F83DRAFT_421271 [Trichoderma novae-zelandiae]
MTMSPCLIFTASSHRISNKQLPTTTQFSHLSDLLSHYSNNSNNIIINDNEMRILKVLAISALITSASAGPVALAVCQAACAMTLYGTGSYGMVTGLSLGGAVYAKVDGKGC